jgi:hypothetical protein
MRARARRLAAVSALLGGALAAVPLDAAVRGVADMTVAAARETEPVILAGAAFPAWAALGEINGKYPTVAGLQCLSGDNDCTHNRYEDPDITVNALHGVPTDRILGYRWDGIAFTQIPLQVDELATRYLSNNASTFSFYSQTDQHLTYVWDEERFRWTAEDPGDPCLARPDGPPTTPDPAPGLDTNDEIVFMASDAGPAAPGGTPLPNGIVSAYRVTVADPYDLGNPGYVYVMRASSSADAPRPAFTAGNGYVRYEPDADSDVFHFSESSYDTYGNTYRGSWFDPETNRCITDDPKQRRPKDTAWIRTPRYAFRYDGRWLMTQVRVAEPGRPWSYGPDLVDQWKARAFQQRPGGETPCCGYEEEVTNWGGSSMLMGVRSGPVRTIRSTWGADSSTNNVRTEVFYRDEVRLWDSLRVHVIPPFDGIYSQWDMNAGKVDTYFNPMRPDGVPVDGQNDEVFGNTRVHLASDGVRFIDEDPIPVVGPQSVELGDPAVDDCPNDICVDNDIDISDPFHSGLGPLGYEQLTGPHGTWVERSWIRQVTGGAAYSLVTLPYYRDDSCFDDGTGTDPGLHVKHRDTDPVTTADGAPRACWKPTDGDPFNLLPRDRFFQGSIGTHGLHIELIADSDNALMTLPLTEISSEQRIVLLPGRQPNLGERYGRGLEKPLVVVALPYGL